jgi:MraZ protein
MLVPPSYKAALTDTVVIGRGKKGQLWIYPKPIYEKVLDALDKTPIEDRDDAFDDTFRFVLAGQEIEFDRQGRLSIPPFLRRQAGITTTAIVAGNGNRVELWKPEQYAEVYTTWVESEKEPGNGLLALRRAGWRP